MTDERCKQIMNDLGQPDSVSLMLALKQVANETEQEVRKECLRHMELASKAIEKHIQAIRWGDK